MLDILPKAYDSFLGFFLNRHNLDCRRRALSAPGSIYPIKPEARKFINMKLCGSAKSHTYFKWKCFHGRSSSHPSFSDFPDPYKTFSIVLPQYDQHLAKRDSSILHISLGVGRCTQQRLCGAKYGLQQAEQNSHHVVNFKAIECKSMNINSTGYTLLISAVASRGPNQ